MTWLRRGRPLPSLAPADPEPSDDADTLRDKVLGLRRYINRNAGRLPVEALVIALDVTDTLRMIVATSGSRALDVQTVVAIEAFANDYVPTTLATFLTVVGGHPTSPYPSGPTPAQSLQEQLESLLVAASSMLAATRTRDADALLTQGSFLRTKFTRSDLDL